MKKYKILLTLLLIVLIAVAAVVVTGVLDIRSTPSIVAPESNNAALSTDYTETYTRSTAAALPLMKTDFENIYYTMSKEGEVHFYKVAGADITPVEEAGNYEVTAECSSQNLTATIHYIEQDAHVFGCGLFTNLMDPEVLIYDYAFFKVTDMFESFVDSNGVNYAGRGAKLLLIDVDSSRFFSDEKIYSEAFVLYEDHTTALFLSNDQRVVGMDAKEKTDYKMFTDDILNQNDTSNVLFFSSRYYVEYDESGNVDIFTSGGSGTNIDNVRYIIDVEGLHFWNYEGETYFFRDNADGSFTLKAYNENTGETRSLEVFSGSLEADYFVRNEYIFNKKTGYLMNVLTGENHTISYDCFKEDFLPDLFDISENGRFCCIRGVNNNNVAACAVVDLETNRMLAYEDVAFGLIANVNMLNDGTVILSVADGANASSYYQLTATIPVNTAG